MKIIELSKSELIQLSLVIIEKSQEINRKLFVIRESLDKNPKWEKMIELQEAEIRLNLKKEALESIRNKMI